MVDPNKWSGFWLGFVYPLAGAMLAGWICDASVAETVILFAVFQLHLDLRYGR